MTEEMREIERNLKHLLCCQALQRAFGELRAAQETMWHLDNGELPPLYDEIDRFIKLADCIV
ncbi:hypothetical protein [Kosakonia sp. R1.Fl]|uniref:hypothetical protein n=1 Tax=Kosakonia sp. R1.Fl TaxID=2928706 RepID=UPI00201D338E|nr:hypothetical protein [Kosakonia sp. R1.Fl]MCL6742794.1 hypothetical protein [Kosakonia sp. R1.Fl]